MQKFKKTAIHLETTSDTTEKFYITGIAYAKTQTEGPVKFDFVFPGYPNLVMPVSVKEISPKELEGAIGLRLCCIMKLINKNTD